ncbi:uncharacterized protein BDZ99DRAFT_42737 [Mytilinidion resinicola]|uniref:C2H2-type domain-containing protein n=1 Tax=Mytilinidion resinicola TaxID=574789 RepID=A0A6A6YLU0_9PEZI|nr:uncharacterized protein BDZ99DRAFT_42737 [Mytilinidion resinicola]KAF2808945.1 hypothetical protein BDZ99DRAFT_42737 [Mytilinidion resinicola]
MSDSMSAPRGLDMPTEWHPWIEDCSFREISPSIFDLSSPSSSFARANISNVSTPETAYISDSSVTPADASPQVASITPSSQQISCKISPSMPSESLSLDSFPRPNYSDQPIRTGKLKLAKTAPTLPCLICPRSFSRPCDLRRHTARHSRPHACTFLACNSRFSSLKDLRRHQRVHSRERPYSCPHATCKYALKGFRWKDACDRHVEGIHCKKEKAKTR